jgi:hypothetical protein
MKMLFQIAVLCALCEGMLSCLDGREIAVMPMLNHDGRVPPTSVDPAGIVGEWRLTGNSVAATWLDGQRLPIDIDPLILTDAVEWYYTFRGDGYGQGREIRKRPGPDMSGGPVEYDFRWEVPYGIRLQLTSTEEAYCGSEIAYAYLYGLPERGWNVTQLTAEKLVLYDRTYSRDEIYGETFWHVWYIFERVEEN